MVMTCSGVVYYYDDQEVAKLADPVFSIITAIFLIILSYPYSK